MDILKITSTMPDGRPGVDDTPTNPLARATAQLLQTGRPFSRLCHCYFDDKGGVLRWLGVFVHSAGNRVIFFPGFAETFREIQGFKASSQIWNQPFLFDHISLESNLENWHITSPLSERHLGSPPTLQLGKSRVLWFGMSIASPAALRLVSQQTVATAGVPLRDTRRRAEIIGTARDGAEFPRVSVNTENESAFDQGFLHFAIIVGPRGFEDYRGPEFGAPFNSPFLSTPLPQVLTNLPIRIHRLELASDVDIQITCMFLPGALNVPVSFTSPNTPPSS